MLTLNLDSADIQIPDSGEVTVSAEQLKAMIARVGSDGELQRQFDDLSERMSLILPIASAGLELARKDITPEETKRHLSVLLDADGTYDDDEKSQYLNMIGQDQTPPQRTQIVVDGEDDSDEGDDMSSARISQLEAELDQLKNQQSTTERNSQQANASILKSKMDARIQAVLSNEKFAGGLVKRRQSSYTAGDEKLGKFNSTISSQIRKATLDALQQELGRGATIGNIDIERLVDQASEQVGGTLQTVIGDSGLGSMSETVAGQSQYEDLLVELGEVKSPTMEQIASASADEMPTLIDQQTKSSLSSLLSVAKTIDAEGKSVV